MTTAGVGHLIPSPSNAGRGGSWREGEWGGGGGGWRLEDGREWGGRGIGNFRFPIIIMSIVMIIKYSNCEKLHMKDYYYYYHYYYHYY